MAYEPWWWIAKEFQTQSGAEISEKIPENCLHLKGYSFKAPKQVCHQTLDFYCTKTYHKEFYC